MEDRSNEFLKQSNMLRFYIDDNDKIYKCDYIESIDGIMHEIIEFPQKELRDLLSKYYNCEYV